MYAFTVTTCFVSSSQIQLQPKALLDKYMGLAVALSALPVRLSSVCVWYTDS